MSTPHALILTALCLSLVAACDKAPADAPTQSPASTETSDAPPPSNMEQSTKAQARSAMRGKNTWSASYSGGGLSGDMKGASIIVAPVANIMLNVHLRQTLTVEGDSVMIMISDLSDMKGAGFVSARNKITVDLNGQKNACLLINARVTVDSYDKKTKKVAGYFEGKGSCLSGKHLDVTIKGTFSKS